MDNKSIAHKVELYISYRIYSEVQKKNHVWGIEDRYSRNHKEIM